MKKTKVEKVVQFKSCSNEDVAEAVLSLAEPLMAACGDEIEMKNIIMSLAVTGWNLSLFSESEEEYKTKINEKIPATFPEETRRIFTGFVLQIIQKKRDNFGGMKKGITEHSTSYIGDTPSLEVKTLPINPKHT